MIIPAPAAGQVRFQQVESFAEREPARQRVLRQGGALAILDPRGEVAAQVPLLPWDALLVTDGAAVTEGAPLVERDPWCDRVLAELPPGAVGAVRWGAGLLCEEIVDELTGISRLLVRGGGEGPPALLVDGPDGAQRIYLDLGDAVCREDGAQVGRGDLLVIRRSRALRSSVEPGGGLPRLLMLLEPPRLRRRALLARQDGVVRVRREADGWIVRLVGADGEQVIRADPMSLAVRDGDRVAAGDALTEGSRCHHELRRIVGPASYGEHLAAELEQVFALTPAPLDTRVVDLLVREQVERLR